MGEVGWRGCCRSGSSWASVAWWWETALVKKIFCIVYLFILLCVVSYLSPSPPPPRRLSFLVNCPLFNPQLAALFIFLPDPAAGGSEWTAMCCLAACWLNQNMTYLLITYASLKCSHIFMMPVHQSHQADCKYEVKILGIAVTLHICKP